MKSFIFGCVVLFAVFARADGNGCLTKHGLGWSSIVMGSGIDLGELNMNGTSYIRKPSQTYALQDTAVDVQRQLKVCYDVCTSVKGSFSASSWDAKCRYDSTWPYSWSCSQKATASCQ